MIIGSAAHFLPCACKRHGKLVTANGESSHRLYSKEEARKALDDGVRKGTVTKIEIKEALRQINESELPEREDGITLIERLRDELSERIDSLVQEPDEDPEEEDGLPPPPEYIN